MSQSQKCRPHIIILKAYNMVINVARRSITKSTLFIFTRVRKSSDVNRFWSILPCKLGRDENNRAETWLFHHIGRSIDFREVSI